MPTAMKLFLDLEIDLSVKNYDIVELLKHNWQELPDDEAAQKDGHTRLEQFEIVDSIDQSAVTMLSRYWNYYLRTHRVHEAIAFAENAAAHGKYVIVWCVGDLEPIVPFRNAIIFHVALDCSVKRMSKYAFGVPSFRADYQKIYAGGELKLREKQTKPLIGFCGFASTPLNKQLYMMARNVVYQLKYRVNQANYVPPPIPHSIVLRKRILGLLEKSPAVETHFILRDRYRAGIREEADMKNDQHPAKVEFVNNILDTDYTVCVRGNGNFSVRFYETLSLGRIPIFIDTDSVLPYDFAVDWKKFCVWVEKHEIPHVAEKVAEFHARLSADEFRELQKSCRQLWVDRLQIQGFYAHFHEYFQQLDLHYPV
jgi:hypothetical protein